MTISDDNANEFSLPKDDDDNDGEEEAVELLPIPTPSANGKASPSLSSSKRRQQLQRVVRIRPSMAHKVRRVKIAGACFLMAVLIVCLYSTLKNYGTASDDDESGYSSSIKTINIHHNSSNRDHDDLIMKCPKFYEETGGEAQLYIQEDQLAIQNISNYLQNYRDLEFDQWGETYSLIKEKLADYKSRKFISPGAGLKSGDSIYESACGIGLNLVMTLEILREKHNISDLTVYGNDFVQESVQLANLMMDRGILQSSDGHKGSICQSDSKNLSHVPSNAFDLVFTGYLTPLWDPLGFQKDGMEDDAVFDHYEAICDGKEQHHETLMKKWRTRQEAWYVDWVGEMIRIAKPGASIIAEQISQTYCDNTDDWDGVTQEFWQRQVKQHWNVKDLEMETNAVNPKRFNVYMRKKRLGER